jgi:predicted dehydrogenase
MSTVRVGIVGVGYMGKTHVDALKDVDLGEAVAVADPASIPGAGPGLAKDYGLDCEESLESLFARDDIDAVIITTPHGLHADHAVPAFEHGKHVLLEKPMELSREGCDRIIEASEKADRKLMIAHSHRYWEGDVVSKRLLEEGAIGDLVMCRDVLATPGYRTTGPDKKWMADLGLYGPGGLIAWGIHDIDRFRWWFGSDAETVFATSHPLRTDIPGDSSANMVMISFRNGGSAHLMYSETLPEPGWDGYSCCAQLVGDRGIMDVNPYRQVRVARDGKEWETAYELTDLPTARQKAFSDEVRDFIQCIVDDTEPPITGRDGRAAVEIALAAYTSAETGKAVAL